MIFLLIIATILWTTARHEASHALVAWLEGTGVAEMALLPGVHPEAGFYFGYVIYDGETSWLARAAPYLVDGALLLVVSLLVTAGTSWRRYRLPILLFGVVSPLGDLAYSYQGGLWRSSTDVADLLATIPAIAVHAYFLGAIGVAVWLLSRLRAGRPVRTGDDA